MLLIDQIWATPFEIGLAGLVSIGGAARFGSRSGIGAAYDRASAHCLRGSPGRRQRRGCKRRSR